MSKITDMPKEKSIVVFDFTRSGVSPQISFSRATTADYADGDIVKTAAINVPRVARRGEFKETGLLIEGSRTNYLTMSNGPYLSSPWSTNVATAVVDENSGFVKITSIGGLFARIGRAITLQAGEYCVSFHVKKGNSPFAHFTIEQLPGNTMRFYLNLDTGAITTNNYSGQTLFSDVKYRAKKINEGEWRLSVSFIQNENSSGSNLSIFAGPATYASTGSLEGEYLYVGPFQVENGLSASSQIVTQSTTVTRALDAVNLRLPAPMDELTLVMWYYPGLGNNRCLFSLNDSVRNSQVIHEISGTNNLRLYLQDSSGYSEVPLNVNRVNTNKQLVSVLGISKTKQFTYTNSMNYNEISNVIGIYDSFDNITIGRRINNNYALSGTVQRLMIFPRLLTREEAIAMGNK